MRTEIGCSCNRYQLPRQIIRVCVCTGLSSKMIPVGLLPRIFVVHYALRMYWKNSLISFHAEGTSKEKTNAATKSRVDDNVLI